MAIREENKKVQDNMDYKSEKEKMQQENRIEKVDVFNLKDYLKYKEAVKNDNVKDVFPGNYPIKQLDLFRELLEKEQERS
jgi:ASC-1-like (ASCH) protein